MVPGGGYRQEKIIQGRHLPPGLPVIGQSCTRRKGDVTGASMHAPRQRNITYVQTVRRSIYDTRRPEHPHSTIWKYKRRPQGPPTRPRYMHNLSLEGFSEIIFNHMLCWPVYGGQPSFIKPFLHRKPHVDLWWISSAWVPSIIIYPYRSGIILI